MTPEIRNVIRKTWSLAALNKMQVTLIFYANLFRIAPETEALFKNDLTSQAKKLMDTLTFIVDHLDEPETLLPAACDLSVRHVDYGVTEEHYTFVKSALLATFADLLGPDFGPKEHAAWSPILQGFGQGNHPRDHRGDKFQGRAPLHDLRAGGKTAVGFNRSELIELRRITPRTDRAVPNGACGAVNRAEVRHVGHLL